MRKRCGYILFFLIVSFAAPVVRGESGSAEISEGESASENLAFLIFDAAPDASYDIGKNGSALLSTAATSSGIAAFNDLASSFDLYSFLKTGSNPQAPGMPSGLSATGDYSGCAQCDWLANPEPNVTGYRLYFGTLSVEQGAASYEDSLDVGTYSHYKICGLGEGTYYFALKAINSYGLISTFSKEASTFVSAGSAQGPAPPAQVTSAENAPGCALIGWRANSEPDIAGYVLYYGTTSVAGGGAAHYADSISAGTGTNQQVCGLAPGTYYFAVKAFNTGGIYSPYSIEKSLAITGVDTDSPIFSSFSPADRSVNIPVNTGISFLISDTGSGVDTNSVSILIDSQSPSSVVFAGDASALFVTCWPPQDFASQSLVDVSVAAGDLSQPANTGSISWSFTTGSSVDNSAPQFCCLDPANGAAEVSRLTDIVVGISDDGSGVDPGSIAFFINDVLADIKVEGGGGELKVTYANSEGFIPGSVVDIRVEACDLSSSPKCSILANYSFSVSNYQDTSESARIIPDGFWAENPIKPLEVRNLPFGWTVNIFNVSGRIVRRFRNSVGDGYNWVWDFRNDHRYKVARSLYLIRIADESGRVREKGRFLVQKTP